VSLSRAARWISLLLALETSCSRPPTQAGDAPGDVPRGEPEAISFLGEKLYAPVLPPDRRRELEARLAEARSRYEADPDDPEAMIWLGRRTAYLGRYREAIAVFTRGVAKFPSDPRFLRHRGHRYITTRRLEDAVTDLEKAAALVAGKPDETEPDGLPNARNIPTSTTNSNIWYHLGLARYLQGDFERALAAYRECLAFSKNPDGLVSTSHWLYMTLRRLGRAAEAERVLEAIPERLDVIENQDYERLLRMYQGRVSPASLLEEAGKSGSAVSFATVGYGVGNWDLTNGRTSEAVSLYRRILAGGDWAAFGDIAAEADLARLRQSGKDSGRSTARR
jgi:tetratricopeptide (TPR) repeat protein